MKKEGLVYKFLIEKQLCTYVDEYKNFMRIENFPRYNLQTREVSLSVAEAQGFDVVASAGYNPQTNQHTLTVSTNLNLSKHFIFHEFTHMLDSELYVNGDKMRYAGLSGYTEYHAAQIELAQLLGAKSIDAIPKFSIEKTISTFAGDKSVTQYICDKQQHAIALFSREDFPADIASLKTAFGILYNYWGLRSICEIYATNYIETINNTAFLKYIPTTFFTALNNFMHGWLDKAKIDLSIQAYINTVFPIIKDYKLA